MGEESMSEKCLIQTKKKVLKAVDIYIRGPIEDFEDYDEVYKEMSGLTEHDVVNVHLNTTGGDCSIGFALIDLFLETPAIVNMIVEYPTYSMGAIMALCGDSLSMRVDSYIMFHDYSGGTHGKGEESYLYTTNFRKVFKNRFVRLCKPFLTQGEIDKMFKGEDIYIHFDDPTIEARGKRHFK